MNPPDRRLDVGADGAPRGAAVRTERLARRYRGAHAVDDVTLTIRAHAITGLLGRNGAGKTTLLRLIAGQERPSSGRIAVFGADPMENPAVAHRTTFVREDQGYPDIQVRHVLAIAKHAFPQWDQDLADRLVDDLNLPIKRKIKKLSRGMKSSFGITLGLASRAELTLLDEPTAGLDPVARQLFYDHLLADYAAHRRTFVLSTHLVDEIAPLLEYAVLMRAGRVALDSSVEELRGSVVVASGPRPALETFAERHGQPVIETVGGRGRATIHRPLDQIDRAAAHALGVTVEPITLQQLLVQHDARAAGSTPDASLEVGV